MRSGVGRDAADVSFAASVGVASLDSQHISVIHLDRVLPRRRLGQSSDLDGMNDRLGDRHRSAGSASFCVASTTLTSMDDLISVFLLDDHEMSRRVVGDMLAVQPDMQLVGTSSGQLGAVGRVHVLDPDVAVLDVRLEEGNGVEACREIRSVNPRTACLLLTGMDYYEALFLAVLAGAAGYVLKRILRDARRRGAASLVVSACWAPAATTSAELERIRSGPTQDEGVADLSDQERQVLDLLAEGFDQPGDRRSPLRRREDHQARRRGHPGPARDGRAPRRGPVPGARALVVRVLGRRWPASICGPGPCDQSPQAGSERVLDDAERLLQGSQLELAGDVTAADRRLDRQQHRQGVTIADHGPGSGEGVWSGVDGSPAKSLLAEPVSTARPWWQSSTNASRKDRQLSASG